MFLSAAGADLRHFCGWQYTGCYSQLVGVILATSRLKDKNNGLCLHLLASTACLISILSMIIVLARFDINCYRAHKDAGEQDAAKLPMHKLISRRAHPALRVQKAGRRRYFT